MNLSKLKLELDSVSKIDLGLKARKLREDRGLSQTELAEIIECDQSTISSIESGKKKYSARKFADLARYFNYDFGLQSLKEIIHTPEGLKKRFADLSLKFGSLQPARRSKSEVLLEALEEEINKQLLLREIENQLTERNNKKSSSK